MMRFWYQRPVSRTIVVTCWLSYQPCRLRSQPYAKEKEATAIPKLEQYLLGTVSEACLDEVEEYLASKGFQPCSGDQGDRRCGDHDDEDFGVKLTAPETLTAEQTRVCEALQTDVQRLVEGPPRGPDSISRSWRAVKMGLEDLLPRRATKTSSSAKPSKMACAAACTTNWWRSGASR